MLRSMYSGIGGMRGFQTKLDVIGNNIANVNTAGFKKSRTTFQDILSQTQAGGNAPTATAGGTNPKQVGLGSSLATIDVIHTQGGLMNTNVPSDLAIQGNGYFVVSPDAKVINDTMSKENYFLTRAGNFSVDAAGNLVTSNGMYVMGFVTDSTVPNPVTKLQKINLLEDAKGGKLQFKDGAGNVSPVKVKSYSIGTDGTITVTYDNPPNVGTSDPIADDEKVSKLVVGLATVANPGGLEKAGNNLYRVTGSANGDQADDTKLFIPGALITAGGGTVTAGTNAPTAGAKGVYIGIPNTGEYGAIYAGQLEMSNVDLAEEFTEMIVAQRGFQANSRIITTSDSILEELVNLKR
jgi:flagellar hook protein FlgE